MFLRPSIGRCDGTENRRAERSEPLSRSRSRKAIQAMTRPPLPRHAAYSVVATALLAACGGLPWQISAPNSLSRAIRGHTPRFAAPPMSLTPKSDSRTMARNVPGAPLLYVVNFDPAYNDVTVYHARARDPSPIETINSGLFEPTGDCIDGHGTLYVANEPGSSLGWISVYLVGQTKPSRMITDGINVPAFCAIDGQGNLWVTNLGGGSVAEYEPGSSKPSSIITDGVPDPNGIAFDHSGSMYVSNDSSDSDAVINVVVYAPGAKSPTETITDGVHSPVGIAVDASGTLYVTNFLQNNVEKYHLGKRHPYETITSGISEPNAVTVGKSGRLYVTNAGGNPPAVIEFPPGSISPSARKITKGLENPEGSAYFPPLEP